jgi:hypothetical protein
LEKVFILNNSLGAVSATPNGDSILATDGQSSDIFIVDGCETACISARRPYRRSRITDCGFSAISSDCASGVYLLNPCFEEVGSILLERSCHDGGLIDAEIIYQNCVRYIVGAFTGSVYIYDCGGAKIARIANADCGEMITDFIRLGENRYAMSVFSDNRQKVIINDNGVVLSANLLKSFVLRMLFYENGVLYGLFGRNYIYNHVIPIYSSGRLILPSDEYRAGCC